MILTRLDDYQGWMVSHGGTAVLIDPWLTDDPITGSFDRLRGPSLGIDDIRGLDLAAILLCTSVSDHLRPGTLRALASVPVIGTRASVRLARRAGSLDARVARVGVSHEFGCRDGGRLVATPTRAGLPLGLIAIGWLIQAYDAAGVSAGRLWIEPHQPTCRTAAALAPLDIAILPAEAVTAVALPVTAAPAATARAVAAARARTVVPTATDPRRDMTGWQRAAYRVRGGTLPLRAALPASSALVELAAGESLDAHP